MLTSEGVLAAKSGGVAWGWHHLAWWQGVLLNEFRVKGATGAWLTRATCGDFSEIRDVNPISCGDPGPGWNRGCMGGFPPASGYLNPSRALLFLACDNVALSGVGLFFCGSASIFLIIFYWFSSLFPKWELIPTWIPTGRIWLKSLFPNLGFGSPVYSQSGNWFPLEGIDWNIWISLFLWHSSKTGNWLNLIHPHWELIENFVPI